MYEKKSAQGGENILALIRYVFITSSIAIISHILLLLLTLFA